MGIDRLYQLPLTEFITARNALARSLRQEGKRDDAEEVKRLVKPSLSAWALNQLYWHATEIFNELVETGDRLRSGISSPASAYLRDAALDRRRVIEKALARAEAIARNHECDMGKPLLERLTRSLEAITVWGSRLPNGTLGRWSSDLQVPGFEIWMGGDLGRHSPAQGRTSQPEESRNGKDLGRRRLLQRRIDELACRVEEVASLAEQLRRKADSAGREVEAGRESLADAEENLEKLRWRVEHTALAHGLAQEKLRETERDLQQARQELEEARREFAGLL